MVTVNGDQSLAQRAQVMRAEGATYAQIKAALGVGSSTVSKLLGNVGTGRPRPRISPEVREQARELRRQGASVPAIGRQLGIARSTAWLITKDIPWTPTRNPSDRRAEGARRRWQAYNERRENERTEAAKLWEGYVDELSARDLLLVGVALYWAEGAKSKPWRRYEMLLFVNSDADMIRVFLRWLDLIGVEESRRVFRVQIHESADVDAALRYWSQVVDVPSDQFLTTNLKRHNPLTKRRNVGDAYHGCLTVRVRRSASEYRLVEAVWRAMAGAAAKTLESAPELAPLQGTVKQASR